MDNDELMRISQKQADLTMDILCPLHVRMNHFGVIEHVGPTMAKLREESFIGKVFWKDFELIRPKKVLSVEQAQSLMGAKIHLRLRGEPATPFKGVIAVGESGIFVNLSFGFGVVDAVRDYRLHNGDFAATDLAIELLFLLEAKRAAVDESLSLNARLNEAKSAAELQATTDALTGLCNRRAMDDILDTLVAAQAPFACMHLDLDFFKSVNDTLGHAAGDHVLIEVAEILKSEVREQDTVARVGGDEFVLLFRGITDPERLNTIANRIIARLEQPIPFQKDICRISGSAGTTISTEYATPDADVMLSHADTALYASKNAGRGQHTMYSPELPTLTA